MQLFYRQLLWLSCVFCLVSAGQVNAHAVVTASSLNDGVLAADRASAITITYNSRIEPGLSQIFLVSKGDVKTKLVFQKTQQPGQVQVELPALVAGDYAILFKVFAADGHLTEDVLHFQVK